jgi:histidinol-phosphate aminotransferase
VNVRRGARQRIEPVDLRLDSNEGPAPARGVVKALARIDPEVLRRYPRAAALEAGLARRFSLAPAQVLVTAGADEALDRICRTFLARREIVLPVPTFEMLEKYALACGAKVREVPWVRGGFPRAHVLRATSARTAAIAVVSPNNPTGLVASAADLRALSRARPGALLIVDLAYAEFADEDLTAAALALPNALVTRTFSKAYGLAGLRVGYVLGPERLVSRLRAGSPFPVSGPSLALAAARLNEGDRDVRANVRRVRREGERLVATLRRLGARAERSQANFVLGRVRDAASVRDGLARLGIAVRGWPGRRHLEDALRITLPGDPRAFARLQRALATVLSKGG